MTTYINLCKRLRREVGASGSDSTVVSASGEWLRLCEWIAQAWEDIQREEPMWEWMRATKTFNTIANQSTYAYDAAPLSMTDFASWRNDSFRIYKDTVEDEIFLDHMPYNWFRDTYLYGAETTTYSRPTVIAVSPSKALVLALPPDDVYTIVGEYYKTPTVLAADADEPDMPERFHMAIVYKAMIHYGLYESAQEVIARGEREYRQIMEQLRSDQLPSIETRREFM